MDKQQHNYLLNYLVTIDKKFDSSRISHKQIHQDMMRVIARLTTELYETQEKLRKVEEKLVK